MIHLNHCVCHSVGNVYQIKIASFYCSKGQIIDMKIKIIPLLNGPKTDVNKLNLKNLYKQRDSDLKSLLFLLPTFLRYKKKLGM